MSNEQAGRLAEAIEIEAWADMMAAMPGATRQALGADCRELGGALSISVKAIPAAIFNRTIGLGLVAPATGGDVTMIVGHMRRHSAPVAQLQVAPFAAPSGLDGLLAAEGLSLAAVKWAKVGRRSDNAAEVGTGLAVEQVAPDKASAFAGAVLRGFGLPPVMQPWLAALPGRRNWRCYIALKGAEIVAGAALFLGADAAWLGIAATVPEARGLGGQSALMARRIADAASLGKQWVFTETGILDGDNPSLRNMYRAGFKLLHERSNWVIPA